MNKGTAEDIARFFSMIGLKEGNMSAFLKEQADMGIRYRGPFLICSGRCSTTRILWI